MHLLSKLNNNHCLHQWLSFLQSKETKHRQSHQGHEENIQHRRWGSSPQLSGRKNQPIVDGSFEFTQPQLIDSILEDRNMIESNGHPKLKVKTRKTLLLTTKLIGSDKGWDRLQPWVGVQISDGKIKFSQKVNESWHRIFHSTVCQLSVQSQISPQRNNQTYRLVSPEYKKKGVDHQTRCYPILRWLRRCELPWGLWQAYCGRRRRHNKIEK